MTASTPSAGRAPETAKTCTRRGFKQGRHRGDETVRSLYGAILDSCAGYLGPTGEDER